LGATVLAIWISACLQMTSIFTATNRFHDIEIDITEGTRIRLEIIWLKLLDWTLA
jgi:hypothetical protein